MNYTNQRRVAAWRERYFAATGRYPDVRAHLQQQHRGLVWPLRR